MFPLQSWGRKQTQRMATRQLQIHAIKCGEITEGMSMDCKWRQRGRERERERVREWDAKRQRGKVAKTSENKVDKSSVLCAFNLLTLVEWLLGSQIISLQVSKVVETTHMENLWGWVEPYFFQLHWHRTETTVWYVFCCEWYTCTYIWGGP